MFCCPVENPRNEVPSIRQTTQYNDPKTKTNQKQAPSQGQNIMNQLQALNKQVEFKISKLKDINLCKSDQDFKIKHAQIARNQERQQLDNTQFRSGGVMKIIRQNLAQFFKFSLSSIEQKKQQILNIQLCLKQFSQTFEEIDKQKSQAFQRLLIQVNHAKTVEQKIKATFSFMERKVSQIIKLNDQLQKDNRFFNSELSEKNKKIKQLAAQTKKLHEIQKLLQILQNDKQEIQMERNRLKVQNQQLQKLKEQINVYSSENLRMNEVISSLSSALTLQQNKLQAQLQRQHEENVKKWQQLSYDYQKRQNELEQQIRKMNEDNALQWRQKENTKNQAQQTKIQSQRLTEYIGKLEQQIQKLRSENEQVKAINRRVQQRLQQAQEKSKNLKTQSFIQQVTLFTGRILDNQKEEKRFMIESIEKHMKKSIEKTELIYDTRRDYRVPFHERVDGKKNLVIVLQTQNALMAGYYSGIYVQATHMIQEGLIISLTNRKRYCLNNFANNPRKNRNDTRPVYGMVYDKFFLIFGNSEIRVKPGDKDRKVFSNFGVSNSYFNSEGDNVDKLLCEGKTTQIDIVSYQLYEVIFDQNIQILERQ